MVSNPFRRILAAGRREDPARAVGGRTLLIHVGPHKTGTTAIQQSLVENAALLRAAGHSYPEVGFLLFGHHGLAGFA
ncbi:MAG TPA: hypothetical protein PKA74_11550, partial [Bauldia sp.]|nr:hypothetical protein [Bauldia sp.]